MSASIMVRLVGVALAGVLGCGGVAMGQCPNAPGVLTAYRGVCAVGLQWNASASTAFQVVRRGVSSDFAGALPIATVGAGVNVFTDTSPVYGANNYYWVTSVPLPGGGCASATAGPVVEQPYYLHQSERPECQAQLTCFGSISITGTFCFDATSYKLYRKFSLNEPQLLAQNATPNFVDITADVGQEYTYTVVPVVGGSGCAVTNVGGSRIKAAGLPAISPSPASRAVAFGGSTTLTAAVQGPAATVQWYRDGVALSNQPGHVAGATTTSLGLQNVGYADAGEYMLHAISACGTLDSEPCVVAVRENPSPACAADFDHSGTLAVSDLFAYLTAWFGGCP